MAGRLTALLLAALAAVNASLQQNTGQQQPLGQADKKSDLIYELKKAEIIPTVIDTFVPKLTLSIFWENATAEVGNTIDPAEVQKAPDVQFIDHVPEFSTGAIASSSVQLTLALTDPDAPSRDNPEWSEICHWVATYIPLTYPEPVSGLGRSIKELMPYKPPGPPPKTGKHRYVFVALAPKNGTTSKLNLSKPGDRQHWGYEQERQGLSVWAGEMGLEVVGANFVYAQNEEQ